MSENEQHGHPGTPTPPPSPVTAGSGKLTTGTGSGKVTTTVATPINLGSTNSHLVDNETNAVITGADAKFSVNELGTGATITLGNGNDQVSVAGGTAHVTLGNGNNEVSVGGAGNVVAVGNGNNEISASGTGNTITTGTGHNEVTATGSGNVITTGAGINEIQIGVGQQEHHGASSATVPVTTDTLNLGNGSNRVFLRGTGNTINDSTGADTVDAVGAGNNHFVLAAAGGNLSINGFSTTNGDTLDLTKILSGVSLAADLSNLGSYVSLTTQADATHASWTDTVLKITGSGGVESVTLVNTGTLTLAGLETGSLVLPPH